MSLLNLNDQLAAMTKPAERAPAAQQNNNQQTQRPKSQLWLNVGLVLPGGNEDGSDLFISPFGIALDDLKEEEVRRGDSHYGQMVQVKNRLREMVKREAAGMKPGERRIVDLLTVELYRKSEPASALGDAETNPLMAKFEAALGVDND